MEEADEVKISSVDFHKDILHFAGSVRESSAFANVTLVAEDDYRIEANQLILSAASPFFKRIISNNPHQHPLLFLRNIDIKTLKSIIRFIYMGQTEVEQEELETFLAVAKDLKVKGLSNEMDTKQSSETDTRQSSEKDTGQPNGMDTR